MKLTDALLGEHAVIYELFDYLRDTILKSNDIRDIHGAGAVVRGFSVRMPGSRKICCSPASNTTLGRWGRLP